MAPEMLLGHRAGGNQYSHAVDIYSYGIVLWELATRREPWDELNATDYLGFTRELDEAITSGRRPALSGVHGDGDGDGAGDGAGAEVPAAISAVMDMCWAQDPEERPSFANVCKMLGAG